MFFEKPNVLIQNSFEHINRDIIRKSNRLTLFIFLVYLAILCLRHPLVGSDLGYGVSFGYLGRFSRIASNPWNNLTSGLEGLHYEIGFVYLDKLIGCITTNTNAYIAIISVISFLPCYYFIKKNAEYPVESWLIFLSLPSALMMYSGLRQAIAMGICLLAYRFVKEKRLIKFIICVFFASLFHRTALFFLVSYPMYYMNFSKNKKITSVVLLPLIFILKIPLLKAITSFFGASLEVGETNAFMLLTLLSAIYVFVIIMSDETSDVGAINLFYVACIIQAFGGANLLITRVGYYFLPFVSLVLPPLLNKKVASVRTRVLIKTVVLLCFVALGLYLLATTDWANTVNYKFYWK